MLPTTAMELTSVDFFLQTLVAQCQATCRLVLHMDGSRGLCQLALDQLGMFENGSENGFVAPAQAARGRFGTGPNG